MQVNIFKNLMDSWGKSTELYSQALNSAGFAQERQNIYLESTKAKIEQLKSTMVSAWQNTISSQAINIVVQGVTVLANVLTKLPILLGVTATAFFALKGEALMDILAITAGESAATVTTVGWKAAVDALNKAWMKNPFLLVAAGVTALISVVAIYLNKQDEMLQKEEELRTQRKQSLQSAISEMTQTKEAISQVNSLLSEQRSILSIEEVKRNADQKQRLHDIEVQLAQILPDSITGYDKQGKAIAENADVTERLALAKQKIAEAKQFDTISSVNPDEEIQKLKDLQSFSDEVMNMMNQTGQGNPNQELNPREDIWRTRIDFIEQYGNKLTKEQKKEIESAGTMSDLMIALSNVHANYTKKISDEVDVLNQYGVAADDWNKNHEKQVKTVDDATVSSILNTKAEKENADTVKQSVSIYQQKADAIAKYGADSEEVATINAQIASQEKKTFDDANKSFQDSINRMDVLKDLSQKIKDKKMDTSDYSVVAKDYPELLAYMGDELTLRDKIKQKINQEVTNQKNAYAVMMQNDATYYNSKIKGNSVLEDRLNASLSRYVDSNGNVYQIDLDNFTTLHEAKAKILSDFDDQVQAAQNNWMQHMIVMGGGLIDPFGGLVVLPTTSQETIDAYNAYREALKNRQTVEYQFDQTFTPEGWSPDGSGLSDNSGSGGSGSGSSSQDVQNLDLKIDRYKMLNAVLSDVNSNLDKNKQAQELANGQVKIDLVKQEIDLLNQKKQALLDIRTEQVKERGELEALLRSNGFNIDDHGMVLNYKEQLQALTI